MSNAKVHTIFVSHEEYDAFRNLIAEQGSIILSFADYQKIFRRGDVRLAEVLSCSHHERPVQIATRDSVVETDTLFADSPDVGSPSCICSRCSKRIKSGVAIRLFSDECGEGEYRYHPACFGIIGQPFECDYCDGVGWTEGGETLKTKCIHCNGSGVIDYANIAR